jgi:CBS domain-containing protein
VDYYPGVASGRHTGTVSRDEALSLTVGEVMIASPKTLPADAAVGDVRRVFERPNVRTALLAEADGRFAGALERDALPAGAADDEPARRYAEIQPVTATPETPVTAAVELLERRQEPRLIVLDGDGLTLRGLLCVNTSGTGFCVR